MFKEAFCFLPETQKHFTAKDAEDAKVKSGKDGRSSG